MQAAVDPSKGAIEVIRKAEAELRQWLVRAAENGDYEAVRRVAEWANELQHMMETNVPVEMNPLPALISDHQPSSRHFDGVGAAHRSPGRHDKAKTNPFVAVSAKGKRAKKGEYPRFLRDGDELLKLGWSKREKKMYRHKAPKRIVLLVCESLQRVGGKGDRFMMDQIFPIADPKSENEVPSYQAYLSLAWLRKEELVVQHGRQGYSLYPETNLADAIEQRWKQLPKS